MEKRRPENNPRTKGERKKGDSRKREGRSEIPNALKGLPFTVRPIRG
jgi:hypothetical protein